MKKIYKKAAISKGRFLKRVARKLKFSNNSFIVLDMCDREFDIFRSMRVYNLTRDSLERNRLTHLLLNVSDFKLGVKYRNIQLYSRGKPFIKLLPWAVSKSIS